MRRMLTMGLALAIVTVTSMSVDAGYYRKSSKPCPKCGKYHVYYVETPQNQNVFQKMWELEKKKNAWLKRTFLGG